MKMIRWGGLAAFVVIVGLVVVFNLLFLDNIIKGIVKDQASLALGTRVDIGDLKTKLLDLRVEIRKLEVANRDKPMRNMMEIGSLTFDLAAKPLLKKKIVIQQMKVEDLAWNTARQTSGALPKRLQKKLQARKKLLETRKVAQSKAEKRVEKPLEDCALPDLSTLTKLKKGSYKDLLAGTKLQSTAFMASYREKVSTTKASWENRLGALPTKEQLKKDLNELQGLTKQRPSDLRELPAYFEKVKSLQQNLQNAKKGLIDAQRDFQTEMSSLKGSLKEVEKLKNQDLKTLMKETGIQTPSTEDVVCVLFGRELSKKVNEALAWYRKLDQLIPTDKLKGEKKTPKPEASPRLKGVDVHFPVTKGYPDFLLEMAQLSIRSDVKTAVDGITFSRLKGQIRDVTTQPALYGKPTVFGLSGSLAGDVAKEVDLSGSLDRRKTLAEDRFSLLIKQLRVGPIEGSDGGRSPLRLDSALFDVTADLRVTGDLLNGRVLIEVMSPKVSGESGMAILTKLLEDMGTFDVTLSIGGTLDKPNMALSSSATKTLASGLQKMVQTELKGLQDGLKKALTSSVDRDLAAATTDTDTLQELIQKELSSRLGLAGAGEGLKMEPVKEKPLDFLKKKKFSF